MAYRPDPTYPPTAPPYDPPYADPTYPTTAATAPTYGPREARIHDDRRHGPDITREVTAGPYRFGLREGVLGTIGIFAILGIVLGVLGFAAAFALDEAADNINNGNVNEAALTGAQAVPAILVGLLPFMAAPVLALGLGAWTGHASRDAGLGASAAAIGSFVGPILMLLLTGIGFAMGAGAANLDLSRVNNVWGVGPGWGDTIPYLFTGAGLLWLLANTLAGGLTGGLVGGLLQRRWGARSEMRRRAYERRTSRY